MRTHALWMVLGCTACTATVVPGNLPGDAAPPGDVVTAEVFAPDAPAVPDVVAPPDAPAAPDAPAVPDVATPFDAPNAPDLTGTWRVVRYRFTGANGQPVEATDAPMNYTDPMSGNTVVVRTNGFLRLARTRFAMSLAMMVNDHIRSAGVENGMDTFSAVGLAVPGLLEGASRFAVTGGQAAYALEPVGADGVRVTFGANAVVDLARTGTIPGAAQVNAVGAAERLRPDTQRPLTNPRVALFWVRPNERGLTERNGVALRFTGAWSPFPLTLAEPPEPAVRWVAGTVPVATAMILVYDDLNNNRVMDLASGDALRGISNITVVWRGDGGDPTSALFRQSAFADLGAGYHYAWRVRDFSTNGVTLLPFDGARPISPDAPVSPTELDPLALESAWR